VSNAGRTSDESLLSPSKLQMQRAMSENLHGDLTNAKIMAYHQKPPTLPEGQLQFGLILDLWFQVSVAYFAAILIGHADGSCFVELQGNKRVYIFPGQGLQVYQLLLKRAKVRRMDSCMISCHWVDRNLHSVSESFFVVFANWKASDGGDLRLVCFYIEHMFCLFFCCL